MENILLSGFADEISSDFNRQIQVLNRLGMGYMEIRGVDKRGIDTYSEAEAREVRRRLDGGGIRVSSLASPIGKIEITKEFSGHFEHFKHVVELAHILDARYIRMFSFFIPQGGRADDYRDQVFERLGALVDYAKTQEVVLLHENEKDIYGDSPKRCRLLMDEFCGDSFRAVFDFANFIQCGHQAWEAYGILKPFIEYVHVKDARAADGVIVPAGQGDGQIARILGDLKADGYEGFISLEPHLTEFEGLKGLEREGASLQGMQKMDGEEAFTIAFNALERILKAL
ncbi:sugar phosphate isomerase/epimerase [Clostridium sp. AF18-27]|uniref:sugar phosphate isomerase/epimerase family protein n=1 Tax=Enterocloster lavalensis TaxID=460384 RepID=UPI000E48D9EF|nr:sugar phosphate isomerase/epimerase family protein [Enterocloster lavalensis]MCB6344688.1 sugar phosphate isomerase/epimerase [Enterocloster lavalensis]RHR45614.1 sugar phosphate isomerase/epimerase [Clostridium sp. AF18-27]